MRRPFVIAMLALFCVACADNQPPGYYAAPPAKRLQDPLPGKALVYLFRAPHDGATLALQISGRPSFTLEPSTYTALTLNPGEYLMEGTSTGRWGKTVPAFEPIRIRIESGERKLLYVSGENDRTIEFLGIAPLGRGGGMLLANAALATDNASRRWKECTVLDAQGFMDISRLKLVD